MGHANASHAYNLVVYKKNQMSVCVQVKLSKWISELI